MLLVILLATPATPATASDRLIREAPSGEAISDAKLIARLEGADVVILGEIHDDPACHSLQADLIRDLVNAGKAPALYFEMLTDQEEIAHQDFLRTSAGSPNNSPAVRDAARKEVLAWEERGWPIWSAYAPIFQLADRNGLPVRHADPSAELMRNIRRFGLLAIPKQLRMRLFENFKEDDLGELSERLKQSITDAHTQESDPSGRTGLIQAQMARDAYMALRLSQAERPAVLIVGVEHARKEQGVPFHLGRRAPHLDVVSISLCRELPLNLQSTTKAMAFDFYWSTESAE